MHGRPSRIRERFEALSCSAGAVACATLTIDRERADQTDGKKTEDLLPDFAGLLRSGDRRAIDEGGAGGVGANSNLFHQGAAKESDDPDVIAATMARPGVVLRRPVGTGRPFSEHAVLPTDLEGGKRTKAARKSKGSKAKKRSSRPVDRAAERKPLSPTNGSKGAASLNGRRKRPPGRRSVNAISRRSIRRRLHWTRPSRSTRSGRLPSRSRSWLLRRDRKLKKPAGIRRRSDWKLRCGGRGVSFCGGTHEQRPAVSFKRSSFGI
ncbi:hypothetical protein Bra471DRAFT_01604 [Bradyrhizobium sp. WSM471]|nr:hypothetical protein Bra471DRAFT_01604 [Bradyrhizobium sp. WSM471]